MTGWIKPLPKITQQCSRENLEVDWNPVLRGRDTSYKTSTEPKYYWAWKGYSGQKRTREDPKHHQSCTALGDEPNRILPRETVVTTWKQSPKRLSGIKAWLLCLQFCIPSDFHVDVWTADRRWSVILRQIFFFFLLAVLFSSAQKRLKYRLYIRKDSR